MEGASTTASWLQAGGVLAFAVLVLVLLRELVPLLKALYEVLSKVRETLAALLERERMRGERLAATDAQRRMMLPPEADFDDPPTNPIAIPLPSTRRTPPHGVPIGVYGPKKPGGRDG
ncbi:MAG TPA: hypothetical protein VGF94_08105 [Kofleriaceae bacterium]|jgi:hypothetical protein